MTSEKNCRSATSIADFIEDELEESWAIDDGFCEACPVKNQCHWKPSDGKKTCSLFIKIRAAMDLEYPGELGMLVRFLKSAGIRYKIITEGLDKDDGEKWFLHMCPSDNSGSPGWLFSKWGNLMRVEFNCEGRFRFVHRPLDKAPEGGWNKQ
jgi:hypothetical protein